MTSQLVIASHNGGKIEELKGLLTPLGIHVRTAAEFNLDAPEETADSYHENALTKARYVAEKTGLPALADDSGIEIAGLKGKPGPHAAPFAEEMGGYDALFEYLASHPDIQKDPRAAAVSVLCLQIPGQPPQFFEGRVEGHLSFPARGARKFGYDPIFVPQGLTDVYATLSAEEKSKISHRARALALLKAALQHSKNPS